MTETTRKLATVRIIKELNDIPGADNIVLAIVDGWQCVVKKNEFKVGDKCIYFEIDSFLPMRPQYEFLGESSYKNTSWSGEGFRIRTIRLKKQLSQGLLIPLENQELEVGIDLTEELNIKLYEEPLPTNIGGDIGANFPQFIPKTHQERIQNIWEFVKDVDDKFEVSLKLDGTSMTLYKYNNEFGICSRNWKLKINDANLRSNSLVQIGNKYKDMISDGFAVQGELIGPGIRGNPHKLSHIEFHVFDIYDIENQQYLKSIDRLSYLNFIHVPICGYRKLSEFDNLNDLLKFSGKYKSLNNTISEGIVLKSIDSDLRFKVINNEYLLKKKD